jgi:hypothetical protein
MWSACVFDKYCKQLVHWYVIFSLNWYVGRVWRYQTGGQIPSMEKGQTTNYKMTNNDQHQSSPKSAISVIGVWQYERVQMSRTLFVILSLVFT